MHEFEILFKEVEVSNLQFESAVANIMVNDAVFENLVMVRVSLQN